MSFRNSIVSLLAIIALWCSYGSRERQVTGGPAAPPPITFGADPHVSPDGSRILFRSNRTGRSQLYVMNLDGSGVRQLTDGSDGAYSPNWSPDGKRIVYMTASAAGPSQIIVMNADASGRHTISEARGHQAPGWSADGSRVLFATGNFPNINIYTMNADGSNL